MKKIILKSILLSAFALSISSCSDFVDNSNEDPDLLLQGNSKDYFQGVLLANQFMQNTDMARISMIWLNQANGEDRQYIPINNWNSSVAEDNNDNWNIAYVNCITQAKIAQAAATKENNLKTKGVMQIVEANCIGTVATLWGDAPYSEIDITGANLSPKFDSQLSIFAKVQTQLDDAISNLNGIGSIPLSDFYYSGNKSKWIKLAYSLKARYYLHTKNYSLAKTNALLGIDSATGDFKASFGTGGSTLDYNPFYDFLVDRDSYMSGDSYAARLLDSTNPLYRGNSKTNESARFAFNYVTDATLNYKLNISGEAQGGTNGKFGNDSDMPLVTYGEMLLIIAEVDARSSFASGLTSYNNYRAVLNTGYSIGVNNSGYDSEIFSYLPYVASDFTTGGIENTTVGTSDQNALIREIMQERYIYFIAHFESFNDFGRTNNSAEIQLKTGYVGTPQRFLYPQIEINANPNTPSPLPAVTVKTAANSL
jgi:starch-binding outer membrane protein, SusD/RagB family